MPQISVNIKPKLHDQKMIDRSRYYEKEIEQLKRLLQLTSENAIFPSYDNTDHEYKDDICRMCGY